MINENKYIEWLNKTPDNPDSDLVLVRDIPAIKKFEADNSIDIGIIENQPFYNIVFPLYKNVHTGRIFRYPCFMYPLEEKMGAATLVILRNKSDGARHFLLERHYRQFHNEYVLEIPRGYGISSKGIETAITELTEEIGTELSEEDLQYIGTVYPDSGISNNAVQLFLAVLEADFKPVCMDNEEQINSYVLLTAEEMNAAVSDGKIRDGFTLSAYLQYLISQK